MFLLDDSQNGVRFHGLAGGETGGGCGFLHGYRLPPSLASYQPKGG